MRFLPLGFSHFSSRDKHRRRPARFDSFVHAHIETPAIEHDPMLDALLRELGEDPFDVWARLCAPPLTTNREASSRSIRRSKRRGQTRRKD